MCSCHFQQNITNKTKGINLPEQSKQSKNPVSEISTLSIHSIKDFYTYKK